MTLDEIQRIQSLLNAAFGRDNGEFLISNASLQDILNDFSERLKALPTNPRTQARALNQWTASAAPTMAGVLRQSRSRADFVDGGASLPVLAEGDAQALTQLCPRNYERF